MDRRGSKVEALGLYLGLPALTLTQLRAEDQAVYRHEFYQEHDDRIRVQSESFLIQKLVAPWLDLKLSAVYDAISGATPTGAPPPDRTTLRPPGSATPVSAANFRSYTRAARPDAVSGASPGGSSILPSSSTLPTATLEDVRWALDFAATLSFGLHRLTPSFSYSSEKDYVSRAGALNYAVDLNQKNTTLSAGWSHAGDSVVPTEQTFLTEKRAKDADDFQVGVSQLLGPETVVGLSFTYGYTRGYLNDPYRGVIFEGAMPASPTSLTLFPEKRPESRHRETVLASLTQAVKRLNASVEVSYRYYHDSFDIHGHTVTLAWFQKVGQFLVLSPSFRYYRQTAASFYATEFPGDPVRNPGSVPEFYSADYRLSELEAFAYGLQATIKARDWLGFDLGYQRYVMGGLDGVTAPAAYPTADIFTIGFRLWF